MQVNFSWKTLPILIIPFTKVFGSSWSKLWVPQWTKTYSTDGETDKASTLHKKFQVCLQRCHNLVLYTVQSTFSIPSDICSGWQQLSFLLIALKNVISLLEYHAYYVFCTNQSFCYVQLVLLLSRMIDCRCSLWRQKK